MGSDGVVVAVGLAGTIEGLTSAGTEVGGFVASPATAGSGGEAGAPATPAQAETVIAPTRVAIQSLRIVPASQ